MKCLTIRQPWAWLIVNGHKPVENRAWRTLVRGEVLIHTAKRMTDREWQTAHDFLHLRGLVPDSIAVKTRGKQVEEQRGCIVGRVTLTSCELEHPSPYFTGPYGHVMTNPQRCEPYPLKGQLGYFNVPDDIVSQLKWINP